MIGWDRLYGYPGSSEGNVGVAKDMLGEAGLVVIPYGLWVGVSGLLSVMKLNSCWKTSKVLTYC